MYPNTDMTPATAQFPAGPGTGTAAQAITPPEGLQVLHGGPSAADAAIELPMAVIVVTVQRDRIQQTVRLIMGAPRTVSRTWDRVGAGSWRSRDPEWAEHEDRIGVELSEYLDALELPTRVAAMLPQPPSAASAAAVKAAQEVARG